MSGQPVLSLPKGGSRQSSGPRVVDLSGLDERDCRDIEAHIRGLREGGEYYSAPPHGWTCFHCGETFRTEAGARLHFGTPCGERPACRHPRPLPTADCLRPTAGAERLPQRIAPAAVAGSREMQPVGA